MRPDLRMSRLIETRGTTNALAHGEVPLQIQHQIEKSEELSHLHLPKLKGKPRKWEKREVIQGSMKIIQWHPGKSIFWH